MKCLIVKDLLKLYAVVHMTRCLLTLFLSVCFSYTFFFYLNPELNLFLHVVVIGAMYHWHSAK